MAGSLPSPRTPRRRLAALEVPSGATLPAIGAVALLRETQGTIGYVGVSVPVFLPEVLPAVEDAAMADLVMDSVEGWDG